MRFATWLCGILLLPASVAHTAPDSATFNGNSAVAISGLVGEAGSSGIRSELAIGSSKGNSENLGISEGSGSPRQALLDVTGVSLIPEPTPFILAGIFFASYFVGRKLRVKSA